MTDQSTNIVVIKSPSFAPLPDLRALLNAAFTLLDRLPVWEESMAGHKSLPRRLRRVEQTGLYIGGKPILDFANDPATWPGPDSLAGMIEKGIQDAPVPSRWRPRFNFSILPTIMIILLPKCPMCFAAFAAAFSSLGFGKITYVPWLLPAMVGLLVVGIAALWWRGRKGHGYAAFFLSLAGAVLLFLGKFTFSSDPLLYAGMVLIVLASLWNSLPARYKTALQRRILKTN